MGWCGATEIIDGAIEAAERYLAAGWQIAVGDEDARTPAFANALNADPTLRDRLDEVLRPIVARIAEKLRAQDWDCIDESDYYHRFPMEMQGWTEEQYAENLAEQIRDNPLFCKPQMEALRKLQGEM